MGYYINQINDESLPIVGKVDFLLEHGATKVETLVYQENLVCVIENIFFDAVAYVFSEEEMILFNDPNDNRKKTWLILPNANKLSGYED